MIQKRKSNLELLRIVAMILIVLFHYGIHGSGEEIFSAESSLNQSVTYLLCSWGLVGVYCFFFISFWFLQETGKVSFLRIADLYFKVVLIDILTSLISWGAGQDISGSRLVSCVLAPLTCRYWFITVYLIVYIINPYLRVIIRNISDQSLVFFTVLLVCMSTIFKMLSPYIGGGQIVSPLTLGICIYFVTAVLKKFQTCLKPHNWPVLSVVAFVSVWIMESILSFIATKVSIPSVHKHIYDLVDIYSIFPLIIAVCLFELFLNKRMAYNKIINWIASHTLCVYLFHENPTFRYWIWDDVFKVGRFYKETTVVYLLHIVLVACTLFVMGIVLDITVAILWKFISKLFHRRLELIDTSLKNIYMEEKNV